MVSLRERLSLPECEDEVAMRQQCDDIKSGKVEIYGQGAMGIFKGGPRLVVPVMRSGGIGTLSGSAPGYPEFRQELARRKMTAEERIGLYREMNVVALKRWIDKSHEQCPHGQLWVNVMAAVDDFESMVRTACESKKVRGMMVGAGIHKKYAEIMADYPDVLEGVISSSGKAVGTWMRTAVGGKEMKRRAKMERAELMDTIMQRREIRRDNEPREPDIIYEERPNAGGHDGARDVADAQNPDKLDFQKALIDIDAVAPGVPVWLGGGIAYPEDIEHAMTPFEVGYDDKGIQRRKMLQAKGVIGGTRFLVTQESEVPDEVLKNVHLNTDFPVVQGMTSPAGLPSSYVDNGFFEIASKMDEARENCISCIGNSHCGFFTRRAPSYCIAEWLTREDGIHFAGQVLKRMRNDPLYRKNGGKYIPTFEEALHYFFTRKLLWEKAA